MANLNKEQKKAQTKRVSKAITDSGGFFTIIAKRAKVSYMTVKKEIKNNKGLQRKLEEESEKIKDRAETYCIEAMDKGDGNMVRFFLKTKAKDRGYTERHEVDDLGRRIEIDELKKKFNSLTNDKKKT